MPEPLPGGVCLDLGSEEDDEEPHAELSPRFL